jgi:hypothetical protein
MRPRVLVLSIVLLAGGCTGVTPSPTASPSPAAAVPTPPAATPTAAATATPGSLVWEAYHSDELLFSLQLPSDWTASRGGAGEGEVLRASGGDQGAMLMTIDNPDEDVRFEEYVRDSFRSLLEQDPDAVDGVNLPGGRAARAVSPRPDGGVSVIYVFAPRGSHSKWLSFTWEQEQPNPLWAAIAERFNAYSPRPIIGFSTPTP